MERRPTTLDINHVPSVFHHMVRGAKVFDCSSSPEAKVFFLKKGGGYYLKIAPKGTLKKEAEMTTFFYEHQLGPEVFFYLCQDQDWLLTRAAQGETCVEARYLKDPQRLCDTTATLLRRLHELSFAECPIQNRTADYIATADRNVHTVSDFHTTLPPFLDIPSQDAARRIVEENRHLLKADTLIHGDYCLPNILLDRWHFSAFIDVGNGGVGDRHIDLFWGIWSLGYNLKTWNYTDRFLDAYGREAIEPDMLRIIAAFECFG